ncbi:MAG: hypothetical protein JSV21_03550 [Nitrospirota bacterium]|nr:MAG: hypothetical protein JSV21_03550 [Nitrospirota bacterium]
MDKLVCYCFKHTEADIKKDVVENKGRSLILEKILTEKKKGNCKCYEHNPSGK